MVRSPQPRRSSRRPRRPPHRTRRTAITRSQPVIRRTRRHLDPHQRTRNRPRRRRSPRLHPATIPHRIRPRRRQGRRRTRLRPRHRTPHLQRTQQVTDKERRQTRPPHRTTQRPDTADKEPDRDTRRRQPKLHLPGTPRNGDNRSPLPIRPHPERGTPPRTRHHETPTTMTPVSPVSILIHTCVCIPYRDTYRYTYPIHTPTATHD